MHHYDRFLMTPLLALSTQVQCLASLGQVAVFLSCAGSERSVLCQFQSNGNLDTHIWDMRTRPLDISCLWGWIELGSPVALPRALPRVLHCELYLFLRLVRLWRGSHGAGRGPGPAPPRPGPRRKQRWPRLPSRAAAAAAILGSVLVAAPKPAVAPTFVPWNPTPSFSSPTTGHQERVARGGNLEKRRRLRPRRRGGLTRGAPRNLSSPCPSSPLTAISNRRARSRAGARRGRGRGRASAAALSSERAGARVWRPEVAWRGFRGPRPLRVLCPGFGDLGRLPLPQPRPSRQLAALGMPAPRPLPASDFEG